MRKRIYFILTILIVLMLSACTKNENTTISSSPIDTSVSISNEPVISVPNQEVLLEEPTISEDITISEEQETSSVEEPTIEYESEEEAYIAKKGLEVVGYYGRFDTPYLVHPIYEK